ncbi:unnamed protein product [Chrysoparadoxa australica]
MSLFERLAQAGNAVGRPLSPDRNSTGHQRRARRDTGARSGVPTRRPSLGTAIHLYTDQDLVAWANDTLASAARIASAGIPGGAREPFDIRVQSLDEVNSRQVCHIVEHCLACLELMVDWNCSCRATNPPGTKRCLSCGAANKTASHTLHYMIQHKVNVGVAAHLCRKLKRLRSSQARVVGVTFPGELDSSAAVMRALGCTLEDDTCSRERDLPLLRLLLQFLHECHDMLTLQVITAKTSRGSQSPMRSQVTNPIYSSAHPAMSSGDDQVSNPTTSELETTPPRHARLSIGGASCTSSPGLSKSPASERVVAAATPPARTGGTTKGASSASPVNKLHQRMMERAASKQALLHRRSTSDNTSRSTPPRDAMRTGPLSVPGAAIGPWHRPGSLSTSPMRRSSVSQVRTSGACRSPPVVPRRASLSPTLGLGHVSESEIQSQKQNDGASTTGTSDSRSGMRRSSGKSVTGVYEKTLLKPTGVNSGVLTNASNLESYGADEEVDGREDHRKSSTIGQVPVSTPPRIHRRKVGSSGSGGGSNSAALIAMWESKSSGKKSDDAGCHDTDVREQPSPKIGPDVSRPTSATKPAAAKSLSEAENTYMSFVGEGEKSASEAAAADEAELPAYYKKRLQSAAANREAGRKHIRKLEYESEKEESQPLSATGVCNPSSPPSEPGAGADPDPTEAKASKEHGLSVPTPVKAQTPSPKRVAVIEDGPALRVSGSSHRSRSPGWRSASNGAGQSQSQLLLRAQANITTQPTHASPSPPEKLAADEQECPKDVEAQGRGCGRVVPTTPLVASNTEVFPIETASQTNQTSQTVGQEEEEDVERDEREPTDTAAEAAVDIIAEAPMVQPLRSCSSDSMEQNGPVLSSSPQSTSKCSATSDIPSPPLTCNQQTIDVTPPFSPQGSKASMSAPQLRSVGSSPLKARSCSRTSWTSETVPSLSGSPLQDKHQLLPATMTNYDDKLWSSPAHLAPPSLAALEGNSSAPAAAAAAASATEDTLGASDDHNDPVPVGRTLPSPVAAPDDLLLPFPSNSPQPQPQPKPVTSSVSKSKPGFCEAFLLPLSPFGSPSGSPSKTRRDSPSIYDRSRALIKDIEDSVGRMRSRSPSLEAIILGENKTPTSAASPAAASPGSGGDYTISPVSMAFSQLSEAAGRSFSTATATATDKATGECVGVSTCRPPFTDMSKLAQELPKALVHMLEFTGSVRSVLVAACVSSSWAEIVESHFDALITESVKNESIPQGGRPRIYLRVLQTASGGRARRRSFHPRNSSTVGFKTFAILVKRGEAGASSPLIKRDLPRTFGKVASHQLKAQQKPKHGLKATSSKGSHGHNHAWQAAALDVKLCCLSNVLHATAAQYPDVGYCQGMDRVVANLMRIFHLPGTYQEELTAGLPGLMVYEVFRSMFDAYRLKELYDPASGGLLICSEVLGMLVQRRIPVLGAHFEEIDFTVDIVCLSWFQTLYLSAHQMPQSTISHIWDWWLVSGDMAVLLRVALAILALAQQALLEGDFEECVGYLTTFPDKTIVDSQFLVSTARLVTFEEGELMYLEQQVPVTAPYNLLAVCSAPQRCPPYPSQSPCL